MTKYSINFMDLENALDACGSSWHSAQAHGLLCGRLSVLGAYAFSVCVEQIFDNAAKESGQCNECESMLESIFKDTWLQLVERQSEFELFLPDDDLSIDDRTDAISQWCDGFLHGLVTGQRPKKLKEYLTKDPIDSIIKDFLEITRATTDTDTNCEDNERAFNEIMEYIRVSVQLIYEDLAEFRNDATDQKNNKALN